MLPFKTSLALALALLLAASPVQAFQTQQTGGSKETGAGGQYKGPGDTVGTSAGSTGGNTSPPSGGYVGPGDVAGGTLGGPTASGGPPPGPNGNPYEPGEPDPNAPKTPEARPYVADPGSWQLWWHYNRWEHLQGGGMSGLLASSGYGGFFLGRGEQAQGSSLSRATQNQVRDVVIPALTKALENGGSVDFVIKALHAYAKLRGQDSELPGRDFTTYLRKSLKSGNRELSEKAILAMGVRGDRRYATWLLSLLEGNPLARELTGRANIGTRERAFTLYSLGLLCQTMEEPALRQEIYIRVAAHLGADRPEVQAAAVMATGLILLPVLPESRVSQARSLGRVDQVLDVLAFFEDDSVSEVARSQAPAALARLLEDAPESVRTRVAHSLLVAIGPHSREPNVVETGAVIALGQIGNSSSTPIDQEIRKELVRVAYSSKGHRLTRNLGMVAFAEASSTRGPGDEPYQGLVPARRVLLRQLSRTRGESLCWTALALGILEEDAADRGDAASHVVGDGLRHSFKKNRSPEVAGALAIALGLLRDAEAIALLEERMKTAGEVHVRGYSGLALGMIGAHEAIPALRLMLEDSLGQPFALGQAAIALSILGDVETGPRLIELSEGSTSPQARAAIAAALGWSRDPRVLEPLCKRFEGVGVSDATKAWTCVALGRICDEEKWPWVGLLSLGVQYDVDLPTLIEPISSGGLLDMP